MTDSPLKILLVGESLTGKTNIILRFVRDEYDDKLQSTFDGYFLETERTIDDVHYFFEIYDSEGLHRTSDQLYRYSLRTVIVIFVFDVTKKRTLDEFSFWMKAAHRLHSPADDFIVVAAGSMIDSVERREVTEDNAREFFAKMKPPIQYFEVSAKDKIGITELFEGAVRLWAAKGCESHVKQSWLKRHESENSNVPEEQPSKCTIM